MIILGIVQGLTEFLPVSSTAHLVFTENFLGISRPGLVLEAVLHLGTALAAVVLFWPDVRRILGAIWRSGPYRPVAWSVLLATGITAVIGIAFAGAFERMFQSVRGSAVQLMVTGAILALARERGRRRMLDVTAATAAAVGLAQGISIVPGISRSAITIVAGMWMGMAREEAARFSFLVAIPAIAGASLFALRDLREASTLGYTAGELLAGFAVAAIFGGFAIRWLLDVVRRGRLRGFAVYCWVLGLAVLASTFV